MANGDFLVRYQPGPGLAPAPKQHIDVKTISSGPIRQSLLQNNSNSFGQRRAPAHLLRNFADKNEWVRVAINRRKRQISQARWHIVRTDNPTRPPDKKVVKAVSELFRYVNPKTESLRSLLDQALEDLLVLDAGCIELEHNLGGELIGLYAVDGSTIYPDPEWTGKNPKAPRYFQYIEGKLVASFKNHQLLYMMANPRTTSARGFSPVEWLTQVIEAELYGEHYDYQMLQQTAPQGMLDLGRGVDPDDVQKFRSYYEAEVAGSRNMAIIGVSGGDEAGPSVVYTPFQRSNKEMEKREYMLWLAKKISAIFEIDLGVFNLTAELHKSTDDRAERLTDEGHKFYGTLIEEFFTREIVWQFDSNHAFRLMDLNLRDAVSQSNLDKVYVSLGVITPNEIRAREGIYGKVLWGDGPWVDGKGSWTGGSSAGQSPTDYALTPPLNGGDTSTNDTAAGNE